MILEKSGKYMVNHYQGVRSEDRHLIQLSQSGFMRDVREVFLKEMIIHVNLKAEVFG